MKFSDKYLANRDIDKSFEGITLDSTSLYNFSSIKESDYSSTEEYENALMESFNILVEDARDVTRSVVHKLRDAGKSIANTAQNLDKATEPLDNLVNNTITKIKSSMDEKEERREAVLGGGYKFNLLKVIRKCITYGGLTVLVGPAITAIAFLGSLLRDKHLEDKEKKSIENELELELKLVDEKIDDAKSRGETERKYELMRIKHKLERELSHVRYGTER